MGERLTLDKHHGLGNDFLIALVHELPADDAAARLAVSVCHRRRGIGADGLIFATVGRGGAAVMRLWNSDGSTAEVSGNGLRCLAHAIARSHGTDELDVVVETPAGARRCSVRPGASPGTVIGAADMGEHRPGPSPDPDATDPAAAAGDLAGPGGVERWETVSVGNPHIVLAVADPAVVAIERAGPAVEALFEGGINVHFAARIASDRISLNAWERGAGATDACGTGAVAAACVFGDWGLVGDRVSVWMPGGEALVELGSPLRLTGPSVHIATAVLEHG